MEFEVVSTLSLTYSLPEAFESKGRLDRPRFSGAAGLTAAEGQEGLDEAYDFVAELTREESELLTVFHQALQLIAAHRGADHSPDEHDEDTETSAKRGS